MQDTDTQFYNDLDLNHLELPDLLLKDELFHKVPSNWHVIITDIKSSTAAVNRGLHETVNQIATGSIVSVLNFAFSENILVPFFFGGDGATFLIPSSLIKKVLPALLLFKAQTLLNYGLELRVGHIPVTEIYDKGHQLSICKFGFSEIFPIPIVLGSGLNYAESVIKGEDYLLSEYAAQEEQLNLDGMQCRWDNILPPENKEEIVTLLVIAKGGQMHNVIFSQVMNKIDEVYGPSAKRQPISVAKLKLKTSFMQVEKGVHERLGKIKYFGGIYIWLNSLLVAGYLKTKKGKQYLNRLVEMSDTLVIDGKINTVISGSIKQRSELENILDKLEKEGKIVYGIHVSNSSTMSCYVRDLKNGHVHFIDGAEGGYTHAASMLKSKLRVL